MVTQGIEVMRLPLSRVYGISFLGASVERFRVVESEDDAVDLFFNNIRKIRKAHEQDRSER